MEPILDSKTLKGDLGNLVSIDVESDSAKVGLTFYDISGRDSLIVKCSRVIFFQCTHSDLSIKEWTPSVSHEVSINKYVAPTELFNAMVKRGLTRANEDPPLQKYRWGKELKFSSAFFVYVYGLTELSIVCLDCDLDWQK